MQPRTALITGINGQDGSYLAELLLAEGVEVHGLLRAEALANVGGRAENILHIQHKLQLHAADISRAGEVDQVIAAVKPDVCFHLAAESFVHYDLADDAGIMHSNCTATHYLLESLHKHAPDGRFYFAASSEVFGHAASSPQDETTLFNPRSAYGIAKLAAYHLLRNYRENFGMFACAGFTYNHESPRRGQAFVTRKITSTVARIHMGMATSLELGNLDALRDWGYAPEYVRAMRLMLANDTPEDYVIATGTLHSVRKFLEVAFSVIGKHYQDYVTTNPAFFRKSETVPLCGNAAKIRRDLGWQAEKPFADIVAEMVHADIERLQKGNKTA